MAQIGANWNHKGAIHKWPQVHTYIYFGILDATISVQFARKIGNTSAPLAFSADANVIYGWMVLNLKVERPPNQPHSALCTSFAEEVYYIQEFLAGHRFFPSAGPTL